MFRTTARNGRLRQSCWHLTIRYRSSLHPALDGVNKGKGNKDTCTAGDVVGLGFAAWVAGGSDMVMHGRTVIGDVVVVLGEELPRDEGFDFYDCYEGHVGGDGVLKSIFEFKYSFLFLEPNEVKASIKCVVLWGLEFENLINIPTSFYCFSGF